MNCHICQSSKLQLLSESYHTGYFCNACGNGRIDYYSGTCCGNQNLISIRFEQSNKTIVQRSACKNWHTLVGGAVKKDASFQTYKLLTQQRLSEIELSKKVSYENLLSFITKLKDKFRIEQQDVFWANYSQYLKSPEWKSLRNIVLERDKNICQGCLSAPAQHVHHLTYNNFGDELLFQLISLCVKCHNKLHPEKTLG